MGVVFIAPACMGLTIYIILPMASQSGYELCSWDIISVPQFIGLDNYIRLFTTDPHYLNSRFVTLKYTLLFVPAMLILTFLLPCC